MQYQPDQTPTPSGVDISPLLILCMNIGVIVEHRFTNVNLGAATNATFTLILNCQSYEKVSPPLFPTPEQALNASYPNRTLFAISVRLLRLSVALLITFLGLFAASRGVKGKATSKSKSMLQPLKVTFLARAPQTKKRCFKAWSSVL